MDKKQIIWLILSLSTKKEAAISSKNSLGLGSEGILELTLFIKLNTYVESTYETPIDIQLGESWPLWELFHALANFLILENIEVAKWGDHWTHILVDECHDFGAELALWIIRVALHKEHDLVKFEQLLQPLLQCLFDTRCRQQLCKIRLLKWGFIALFGDIRTEVSNLSNCICSIDVHLGLVSATIAEKFTACEQGAAEINLGW